MSGTGLEDRQAALTYLKTATRTADAAERDTLRRRAAELILPRGHARATRDGRGEAVVKPSAPGRRQRVRR